MAERLLHTPDGVRDIYGVEYERKQWVEEAIGRRFRSFGYRGIQTPTFEYFDVFSREIGTTPSKDLFKMMDGKGDTLVLRPDFTPGVARSAAKYFGDDDGPLRFCYLGNTYVNRSSLQGKMRETTEMGVELIGDGAVDADAETVALAVESLLAVGLQRFQISIGQVEYFKGMCAAAGIAEETEWKLRDLVAAKNIFGVERLLDEAGMDAEHRERLIQIGDLLGSYEILQRAADEADNPRSRAAVARLRELYQLLCLYGVEKYVAFDLGMLSQYNYYTGIIFKCYAYGVGDVIAKGGRYDNLLARFGKAAPAVGFGLVVDDLLVALARQKAVIPDGCVHRIKYDEDGFEAALATAHEMRRAGERVILDRRREENF